MPDKDLSITIFGALMVARAHRGFDKQIAMYHVDVEASLEAASVAKGGTLSPAEFQAASVGPKLRFVERVIFAYGVGIVIMAYGLARLSKERDDV